MSPLYLAIPMLFGLWWKADDWLAHVSRRDGLPGDLEWIARVACWVMFVLFETLALLMAQ